MDHDHAARHIDLIEAHMDEGGGHSPHCVRDLIKMMRELISDKIVLLAELYNERKQHIITCGRCQQPIEREYQVYRCTDCDMAMHKRCAKDHFVEASAPPHSAGLERIYGASSSIMPSHREETT